METKRKFYVFGGLWFDKVNGNTYNVAKIIDTQTDKIYYTRFTYGYGNSYISEAENYIQDNLIEANESYKIVNIGLTYYKKSELKNNWF